MGRKQGSEKVAWHRLTPDEDDGEVSWKMAGGER